MYPLLRKAPYDVTILARSAPKFSHSCAKRSTALFIKIVNFKIVNFDVLKFLNKLVKNSSNDYFR